jgi:hypothetical protein
MGRTKWILMLLAVVHGIAVVGCTGNTLPNGERNADSAEFLAELNANNRSGDRIDYSIVAPAEFLPSPVFDQQQIDDYVMPLYNSSSYVGFYFVRSKHYWQNGTTSVSYEAYIKLTEKDAWQRVVAP